MQKVIARTTARLVARILPTVEAGASCGSFTQRCSCSSKKLRLRTCYACSDGSVSCGACYVAGGC